MVTSQFTRFHRICSTKSEFIRNSRELIQILSDKHYRFNKLKASAKRYIFKHPYLYGARSCKAVLDAIVDEIER